MPPMGSTQKQTLFALALASVLTLASGCQSVDVGPVAPPPAPVAATLQNTEVRAIAFPSGAADVPSTDSSAQCESAPVRLPPLH